MADESINRKKTWLKAGCNGFESNHPKSTPMAFWTEQDVLHYLKDFNIPYCDVYGDIIAVDQFNGQITINEKSRRFNDDRMQKDWMHFFADTAYTLKKEKTGSSD